MTFLWVIIYLVAGFGAYWVHYQEYNSIINKMTIRFGNHTDEVYAEFHCLTQIQPKIESGFVLFIIGAVMTVMVWALWPLFVVGGGLYEWLVYRHLDKVWSKKLGIE